MSPGACLPVPATHIEGFATVFLLELQNLCVMGLNQFDSGGTVAYFVSVP